PELFEPSEIATFAEPRELRDQIRHYLGRSEERRALAAAARRRALADHTYAARMRQLLELLYPAEWLRRATGAPRAETRADLEAELAPGHCLRPILGGLPPDTPVSLERLIDEAASRGAQPTEAELTLRFMSTVLAAGERR